jgi:hypothetical protein
MAAAIATGASLSTYPYARDFFGKTLALPGSDILASLACFGSTVLQTTMLGETEITRLIVDR